MSVYWHKTLNDFRSLFKVATCSTLSKTLCPRAECDIFSARGLIITCQTAEPENGPFRRLRSQLHNPEDEGQQSSGLMRSAWEQIKIISLSKRCKAPTALAKSGSRTEGSMSKIMYNSVQPNADVLTPISFPDIETKPPIFPIHSIVWPAEFPCLSLEDRRCGGTGNNETKWTCLSKGSQKKEEKNKTRQAPLMPWRYLQMAEEAKLTLAECKCMKRRYFRSSAHEAKMPIFP